MLALNPHQSYLQSEVIQSKNCLPTSSIWMKSKADRHLERPLRHLLQKVEDGSHGKINLMHTSCPLKRKGM